MPGYVEKALKWFGHEPPKNCKDQLHEHIPPVCGTKQQFVEEEDALPEMGKVEQQFIRQVLGMY